jgi:hypothetical protein
MRSLALVLLLAACGGSKHGSYTVVQQAEPNPFRAPGCKLSVEPVSFDKLDYAGQPEATRLASMPADQQTTWQDDKKAFSFGLKQQLVASRGGLIVDGSGSFSMRPSLLRYAPGGEAELLVDVTDPNGAVLDEIRVTSKVLNLREAASALGKNVDRYVHTRFTCAR